MKKLLCLITLLAAIAAKGAILYPLTIVYNITNVSELNTYITTNVFNTFTATTVTNVTLYSTTINSTTVNSTTMNVSGKAQINTLIITNGVGYYTNVWSGPSNVVDMSLSSPYDLNYVSLTPCAITGFIGKSNQITSEKLLQLYNSSASNWNVTTVAGLVLSAGGVITNTVTVSNATVGVFWLRYSPGAAAGPRTNGVYNDL